MTARVIRVEATAPDRDAIREAADVIRSGGLVAFPTETVYGLGANALDPDAVQRIFDAKGRPGFNPLIVHVPDLDAARAVTGAWPMLAERAAAAFWPGPITLVLDRDPSIPDVVTAGLPTVGVRVPAHPVALALLREAGLPVAAPSANPFTRVSPTAAEHVVRGLGERADLILDGGATPYGIESTVVAFGGERPRLLRPGAIDLRELEAVLGPVEAITMAGSPALDASPRPAPGMLERHYSPAAEVMIFNDDNAARDAARRIHDAGGRVGGLVTHAAGIPLDEVVPLPDEPRGYARLLYAALHALDDAGCSLILVEALPGDAAWAAIRDRLERASHGPEGETGGPAAALRR
jgi:L-threonylcarbamoyladenylate synthase